MTNNILTMEIRTAFDSAVFAEDMYSGVDYGLRRWRGLDSLQPTVWERSNPFDVGSQYTGRKVQPRTANFTVSVISVSIEGREQSRRRLAALLAPHGVEMEVFFTLIDGTMVFGSAVCTRTNFDTDKALGPFTEYIFQLRFLDPLFYGTERHSRTVQGVASEEGLDVPLELPLEMGDYSWGLAFTESYNGTWISKPEIILNGPINNIIVSNATTGGIVRLTTDYTLPAGSRFLYRPYGDLVFGLDSGSGPVNASYLINEQFSNIDQFHLQPGLNELSVQGTDTESASYAQLRWREIFTGV